LVSLASFAKDQNLTDVIADLDIIHAHISGQIVVVLSSVNAATDLRDRRTSTYSSRPRFLMVNEFTS
jgi:hypothetical protein